MFLTGLQQFSFTQACMSSATEEGDSPGLTPNRSPRRTTRGGFKLSRSEPLAMSWPATVTAVMESDVRQQGHSTSIEVREQLL